ncbi:hypothetical protein AHF37_01607 [Paragonimus kellicotti]|nr:hypothetical protein AHF37_01607 [Paragonimus kellicotti]
MEKCTIVDDSTTQIIQMSVFCIPQFSCIDRFTGVRFLCRYVFSSDIGARPPICCELEAFASTSSLQAYTFVHSHNVSILYNLSSTWNCWMSCRYKKINFYLMDRVFIDVCVFLSITHLSTLYIPIFSFSAQLYEDTSLCRVFFMVV